MSLPFLSLVIIFYTFKYFNFLKNCLLMCFSSVDAGVVSGVSVGIGVGLVGVGVSVGIRFPPVIPL